MTLVRFRNRDYSPVRHSHYGADDMFNWFAGEVPALRGCSSRPSANIIENNDDYRIELQVPGYRKEDIRIQIENGILSISHEKERDEDQTSVNYVSREFQPADFERSFSLSDRLASDKISARYTDGILEVTIPKKEEAKARPVREISIK